MLVNREMATRALKESLTVIRMLGSATCRQQSNFLCSYGTAATATTLHRPFHSCTRSSALAQIVSDELKFEQEDMGGPADSALENAPEGWKLEHRPERTIMTLTQMLGGEKVVIRLNTLSTGDALDEGPAEDNADGPTTPITFTVDSIKGNTALRFDCEYMEDDEEDPVITDVMLVSNVDQEATMNELEPNEYTGPNYNELDEKLQAQFQAYIKHRGIDANMGHYLCRLNYDKEQEDYVAWLEKLKTFVSK